MARMPYVFLTSGVFHPGPGARRAAYLACRSLLGDELHRIHGITRVRELTASGTSLCVAYFHHSGNDPRVVRGLCEFVHDGGSLLALHGVSASFKGNPEYEDLLGGVFTGHGRSCRLRLVCSGPSAPQPSSGVPLIDEPYDHRVSSDVEIVCRWTRVSGVGVDSGEPRSSEAAWKRVYHAGRVAYLSLGHRRSTWFHPEVRSLLGELLTWCIDGRRR